MPESNGTGHPVAQVSPEGNKNASPEKNQKVSPEGSRTDAVQAGRKIPAGGEHPSKRDWPKLTDVAVVILTLGLVLVGILQSVIFYEQWHEMVSGGSDTHELAVAAEQQAKASEAQANEAKAQVEKLTESLKKTDLLLQQETAQARTGLINLFGINLVQ